MKRKSNNPNGRPKKNADDLKIRVSFRLRPDVMAFIKRESQDNNISQAEVIERAIDKQREFGNQ